MQDREKLYQRIRGLLKQAESTPYEEEAAAFLLKAQELMQAHAVEEELLWASDPGQRQKVILRVVNIGTSVTGSKFRGAILNAICKTNRCLCWGQRNEYNIAGYESDILYVEMLYTSIYTQMNFAMVKAQVKNKHVQAKVFRNNFMLGYASRISQRLLEAHRSTPTAGGTGKELVLHREALVRRFVEVDLNIKLVSRAVRNTGRYSGDAARAGMAAANEADLSGGKGRVTSGRKALGA